MSASPGVLEESAAVTPLRATAYGLGLAALWLLAGFINPGTTYHLAPLLVSLVPAAAAARSAKRGLAVFLGAAGLAIALVTTLILAVIPGLDGPTLGPFSSASQETVALALAGALAGAAYAAVRSDR